MKSRNNSLDIWMNGEKCGTWTLSKNGVHEFAYTSSWMDSPNVRPISLSMPTGSKVTTHTGPRVDAFFDNLLPDSPEIRRRIQARVGAASTNAIDLLREIGGDCAGAFQFMPEGKPPLMSPGEIGQRLNESAMAAKLRSRIAPVAMGIGDEDDFRISLAGSQKKTALLRHKGHWYQPKGAAPSTHIFKFPMGKVGGFQGDLSKSVENEWLCAEIARKFGLAAANCEMATFEDMRVLIVERFDRKRSRDGKTWLRLPQEDLCQAMAVPKGIKYESEGAPGMSQILDLLLGAKAAEADRIRFFKSQVLFWLLCAPDGHARNFSIFIEAGGEFSLTPLYDVISAYPIIGHGKNLLAVEKVKIAMSVPGKHKHRMWDGIARAHWKEAARNSGLGHAVEGIMSWFSMHADGVATEVSASLTRDFPDSVSNPILEGLRRTAKLLAP